MRGPRPFRLFLLVILALTPWAQSFWFLQAWRVIATVDGQHACGEGAGGMPGSYPICIKASYLPHHHGFRPREHPPYNTHSLQVIGDSFGVFFFVYTTLSGELA